MDPRATPSIAAAEVDAAKANRQPTGSLSLLACHFRWVICTLLLLGVTKNYMDRQVLGVLGLDGEAVRSQVHDPLRAASSGGRLVDGDGGLRGHRARRRDETDGQRQAAREQRPSGHVHECLP